MQGASLSCHGLWAHSVCEGIDVIRGRGTSSSIAVTTAPSSNSEFGQDLLAAIGHVKHGNGIAQQHRKRSAALPTRLAGLVLSSLNTSGVGFVKSMTDVERHAELVYAETLFEKVVYGLHYILVQFPTKYYVGSCGYRILGRLVCIYQRGVSS